MFVLSRNLAIPLVVAFLVLFAFPCSPCLSQPRLGINLVDRAEYSRPKVVRITISGNRGSRSLVLIEIPAGEKREIRFRIACTDKRVALEAGTNDGTLVSSSPWEMDGILLSGQGTGFYIRALEVAEPGRPADTVVLRSELGEIRFEIWIAPLEGQWRAAGQDGRELNTGVVGVHSALVRQGDRARVLFFSPPGRHPDGHWDGGELNNMDVAMWDIGTNRVTITNFSQNLFCSGHALLPDGRLLIAGGHIGIWDNNARGAFIFDAFLASSAEAISPLNFLAQPVRMQNARWYPTVTALPDGKMLISSGRGTPLANGISDPGWYRTIARDYEVFQLGDPAYPIGGLVGRFQGNGLEERDVDFATYPATFVLSRGNGYPNGAVFMQEQRLGRIYAYRPAAERVLEQAQDDRRQSVTWTMHHQGSRSYPYYGAAVLLPFASNSPRHLRVLVTGGQGRRYVHNPLDLDSNQPATATTEIFDFDNALPLNRQRGWRTTSPMGNARFLHDATLLANGEVLISGGASQGWTNVNHGPVFNAELFDPVNESFRPAARASIERRYHSVALLLPDGTVLKAGSTGGYTNETLQPQLVAERYFPPYMWRGPKPVISTINGVSPNVNRLLYAQSFDVEIQGTDLSGMRAALVRTTSVTHGNNMDQRYVWIEAYELGPTANGDGVRLRVRTPEHGSIAPPGDYMLVVVDRFGVPSPAKFIRLAMLAIR
jgi:hypothetical protein